MKSRKGEEDLVFVSIVFSLAITLAFVMFLLTAGHENKVEKKIDREISYQIGDIRKRSTITTTMDDHMWRAPGVEYEYDQKAYKMISYYFSTSEDHIYLDGEKIDREKVGKDLKIYLKYKMDKYWNSGANNVDYYLNISRENSGDYPTNITVKRSGYYPEAKWSAVTYPIALADGESATAVLWTKTSRGIYGVSGE